MCLFCRVPGYNQRTSHGKLEAEYNTFVLTVVSSVTSLVLTLYVSCVCNKYEYKHTFIGLYRQ